MPLLVVLLLLIVPNAASAGDASTRIQFAADTPTIVRPQEAPQNIVQHLYADHFMHNMAFTRANAARKKDWLTLDLYLQIDAYFRRPASPDTAPAINGDPLTDTQEYPSAFSVGRATQYSNRANVPVVMTIGANRRTIMVRLIREPAGWLIDDFVYEDGNTLRSLLKAKP